MVIECAHCGRNVAEENAPCPFCLKDPKPAAQTEEEAKPKISYRLKLIPKEKDKTQTGAKNQDALLEMIKALTQGTDTEREAAMDYLLGEGHDMASTLSNALSDSLIKGREHIAKALGRMGSRSAVPALIEALESSELDLRLAAAWALCRIGDLRAMQGLLSLLKDRDPRVRSYITYVVGGMGENTAVPQIARMLEDLDPEVRGQAVLSLTYLEGKKGAGMLRRLKKDPNPHVRLLAQEALRLIGGRQGVGWKTAWIALAALGAAAAGIWIYLH